MRVLLISANTEQVNMPVLPMGLAHVAAAVERSGHEVRLLNLMIQEGSPAHLQNAIGGFRPEAIGISVRNIDDQNMASPRFFLNAAREIVRCCRELSGAPLILGGAGYSLFPQSSLLFLGADMGIQGEGEEAFTALLERLGNGTDIAGIPGLVLPAGGSSADRRLIRSLDSFPFPAPGGDLPFPTEFKNQKIRLPFQTRRGCPMECSYCPTPTIEGRILRKRSPQLVVEAISRFVEAGFIHFFFVDNTFNLPPSYAAELCDKLIEKQLNIQWSCILYPWKVSEALVEKMAQAGCVEVSIGSESGSREILKSLNKRFGPEEVRSISGILKRHEIDRMGFLLLGGPGETRRTVLESLAYVDSLDLESVKVTVGIRIYPHTALARTAVAQGIISPADSLLHPTFYMTKELDGWLQETVAEWTASRSHWIS